MSPPPDGALYEDNERTKMFRHEISYMRVGAQVSMRVGSARQAYYAAARCLDNRYGGVETHGLAADDRWAEVEFRCVRKQR